MTAGCRTALIALLLSSVFVAGCRRNDLVENELRHKEALLRDAVQDLKRTEAYNEALQREVQALRQSGPLPLPPETASNAFGLKRIVLARGTGGHDSDNLPGDEALQVVVEPRDVEDHVVKVPGGLLVTAIEINPQGLKRALCWWALTPEQLRPHWKQGLLGAGYSVVLPWTVFPQHENVRVVAQFKLADGRIFEADKDLKVRLLPAGSRPQEIPVLPPPSPLPVPLPLNPSPFIVPSGGAQPAPASGLQWMPVQ